MRASWPSRRSWRARWRTWSFTPPGDAKSYGETSPILMSHPACLIGRIYSGRHPSAHFQTPPKRGAERGARGGILIPSRLSWAAVPNPVWHVPLIGVASDEPLDVVQELLRHANLVGFPVAGALCDHEWSCIRHERVVRQPVDAGRQQGRSQSQRDGGGAERYWSRPAEERHQVASSNDVAIDRCDHHLLLVESLRHLADAVDREGEHADAQSCARLPVPLEQRPRFELLREEADRRQGRRPDRRDDLV